MSWTNCTNKTFLLNEPIKFLRTSKLKGYLIVRLIPFSRDELKEESETNQRSDIFGEKE